MDEVVVLLFYRTTVFIQSEESCTYREAPSAHTASHLHEQPTKQSTNSHMQSHLPPYPQPCPAIPITHGFNLISPSLIGPTHARSSSQPQRRSHKQTERFPSFTVANQNPVILYAIACPSLLPITEAGEIII